jgi:DnaJ-class molecular chaperone
MPTADDREDPPEVEVVCPDCHGSGKCDYSTGACPDCDGTGHVPTKLGRKILAMVCRNLGRVLRDTAEE